MEPRGLRRASLRMTRHHSEPPTRACDARIGRAGTPAASPAEEAARTAPASTLSDAEKAKLAAEVSRDEDA